MFDSVNEPSFRLDVAELPEPFEVLAFTGNEGISEPFAFDIDIMVNDPHLDLAGLLHRCAFLQFGLAGNGLHGQLQSVVQHEHGEGLRWCRVTLGPKLNCLALRFSQRIFSGQSVPQILAQVLREHGIFGAQRRFDLHSDYPVRTFCTQYRESDLQFVQRLCAQASIHYYFEHRPDGHSLVFVDDSARLPVVDVASPGRDCASTVQRWVVQVDAGEGPERPAGTRSAEGRSTLPILRSAQWLALRGHPLAECNRHWLLSRIEHRGDPASEPAYSNQIFATAQALVPRSASRCARPHMHSLQRAWVVTVDEPQPDAQRPVAVQFDWLYQGEGAAASHCWLPLAPALREAALASLREGVEVVVSFLEGDPDQPVISGVLQEPSVDEDDDEASLSALPDDLPSAGLVQWLKSEEPLLLLCLIPGGGSYSHCSAAICSCRLVASLDQGGAT